MNRLTQTPWFFKTTFFWFIFKQVQMVLVLISNILSDDAFTRLNSQINIDISDIDTQLAKLEQSRKVSIEQIQLILRFARNIENAYEKAGFELKRHYLGLFFERLETRNGEIKNTVKTPLFNHLVETNRLFVRLKQKPLVARQRVVVSGLNKNKVQLRPNWGAQRDSHP